MTQMSGHIATGFAYSILALRLYVLIFCFPWIIELTPPNQNHHMALRLSNDVDGAVPRSGVGYDVFR